MNTSRFFLAGILWMRLLALGRCRKQRTTSCPGQQSSIIFAGRSARSRPVLCRGADIGADIVVRVDSVLKSGGRFSEEGDNVTVSERPAAFQEGTQATFYARVGSLAGVAVKELGHRDCAERRTPGGRHWQKTFDSYKGNQHQDLQRRIALRTTWS